MQGFTEVADQSPGQTDPGEIEFSHANGLIGAHPIATGRSPHEQIRCLRSFTGQSLDAPDAVIILKLPANAAEYFPNEPKPRPVGSAQGVALEYGRGRVVALGEAAMLTAQTENGARWGMNTPGLDNKQFALNIMHWLSRAL